MGEQVKDINKKTSILLSRITPVALVVGTAGFLGSNLTESLLEKGIQVVGVDNFSTGKKQNLELAIKNSKFHLVEASAENLGLGLPRLDYIFIVAGQNWNIDSILGIFKESNSLSRESRARCLFVSWIDLYNQRVGDEHKWFKEAEGRLAKFANEHRLNARVLRLGPVFGPRMQFDTEDPIIRLIQAQLLDEIQKEAVLEFSSRAVYVWDACDLMIKSIMAGSTAQKIFDGVSNTPIKVTEIKQVLLDPLWYEQKGFNPSELPPWPTPNLEKTMNVLHWRPRVGLVEGLRKTLAYFKDNEIKVPELEKGKGKLASPVFDVASRSELEEGEDRERWRERRKELESFKVMAPKPELKIKKQFPKIQFLASKLYLLIATGLIVLGLIYPLAALGWGIASFKIEMQNASSSLGKGELDKSQSFLARAKIGIDEAKTTVDSLEIVRKAGFLEPQFKQADRFLTIAQTSVISMQSAIKGVEALYLGLKAATGEVNQSPFEYFTWAQVDLEFADDNVSSALALIKSGKEPQILKLGEYLEILNSLVQKAQAASIVLPKIISSNKSYLILLQNNMELRPIGGFIGSYGLISFEGGKLKELEVNDIYAIDGQLPIHVEPPKEIKEDLGQKDWFLRDSNWEPDFPTSAKQAEWFFNKETGTAVAGVFALDVTAMENLLEVLGPLELSDYNEKITSENLFEKAITHAEQGFFPGSQAKKSFLTALTAQTLNKLFFLPNQNWAKIVEALGKSTETKHINIYLDDPKLFSYLVSQRWSGVLPRPKEAKPGVFQDFLAPVEANFGANKVNYYLDRNYSLETVLGKEGEVRHRLRINYTNRSPSDAWPGGKYKNRFRIYLPFGSKLTRALWGEAQKTSEVAAFVDYGRAGYSMLLELEPKQQKTMVLDYEVPGKIEFKDGKAIYRLDIIKQAGTLKDPISWKLTYPINYKVVSEKEASGGLDISPQEHSITTDLSKDRSFEVVFRR